MKSSSRNDGRKLGRKIVLAFGALLLVLSVTARGATPATQPADSWTAPPPCHETTLNLPKTDGPLRGDEKARGETALRNAVDAMRRGETSAQKKQAIQAASLFLAAGEKNREGAALQLAAAADESLGHFNDATCELEEAASIADSAHDRAASAAVHSSLGALETMTRAYGDASFDLNMALDRAHQGKDARVEPGIHNNLGNLYAALAGVAQSRVKYSSEDDDRDKAEEDADQAQALKEFDRAVELADQSQNKLLAAKAATNAAVAAVRDGQFDDAVRRNGAALDRASSLPDTHEKAYLLSTIGKIDSQVIDQGKGDQTALLKQASDSFARAIQTAQAIGDSLAESYATGMHGRLEESHGSPSDAIALSRRATFLAQKAQSPDSLYLWQWQTARLLSSNGAGRDDAISAYTRASDSLQTVRSDIALGHGNGDPRSSFREDVGPLYFQLADLLLRRAEDIGRTPREQREDLLQAREVVERLKSGELEDYFQDPCVNQARIRQQQIAALDPHTAVLYIIPLEDRTELLLDLPVEDPAAASVPGAGLKAMRVPGQVGRARLEEVVGNFRNALERRATNRYRKGAAQLYEWLIVPIDSLLKQHKIQTLIFVPDGALRTVPMASLFDVRTGQFLIEQYATGVTPGLTLMEPRALVRKNVRVLLNGLSVSRFGFDALPSVPGELNSIRGSFPADSKQLLNEQFVLGTFRSEIRDEPYTIVHIASHGEFRGDAKKTFILAYDQRMTLTDLQSLIQPSEFRGRPVELLTLSACRTAAGDDRAALGLAGVAIKAGARSALASLWSVNDNSSSRLIADFYQELSAHAELSKAQALQRAQLRLLHDPDLSHPIYWAPYIVIGNWL